MRKAIYFSSLLAIAAIAAACGGPTVNTNSGGATNSNTGPANQGNLAVSTPTPAALTNNAPTLAPLIKSYCEAMNKGDEAALRKIYSADTIKSFETQMKQQNVKTLMKFLEDDKVGATCELTNEQINGETATAIFKTDTYKTGLAVMFVKEGGDWKLTNKSPEIDKMKPSTSSNSNVAK